MQALCWSEQALSEIREPRGDDFRLHILKAALIERLVEVYNHPIHGGAHHAPQWCLEVPGVYTGEEIWLIRRDQADFGLSQPLRRRGVIAWREFLMFA